jgi:hypothetical protein
MIRKVAVPPAKHSPMFGLLADRVEIEIEE